MSEGTVGEQGSDFARRVRAAEKATKSRKLNPDINASSLGQKIALATGAATAATSIVAAVTGNAYNLVHGAQDAISTTSEALSPDISREFTTPKELLKGSAEINIDGGLKGRKIPNTEGKVVDWNDIKLVSTKFNPEDNLTYEDLLDLSETKSFFVENPLFVNAQNPDGGAFPGRWLKLAAEKDGDRFDLYISLSQQTSSEIDIIGKFINIKTANRDGTKMYLPEQGEILPNGAINHTRLPDNTSSK